MHRISDAFTLAWVPLLGSCMMMGGLGHATGLGRVADAEHTLVAQAPGPRQRAEASNGALTIALSFPTPSSGAAVAIDAWLRTDDATSELTDGQISLRIQRPSGNIDHLRMQRASVPATYQAQYSFSAPGLYVVTAEGRTVAGPEVRTVSVTTRAEVVGEEHGGRHDWLMPVVMVGGLGMVATMALLMGGSAF